MAGYNFEMAISPGVDGLPAGDVVGYAEAREDSSAGDWWIDYVEVHDYFDESGRAAEYDISRAFRRGSKDPLARRIIGILESDADHVEAITEAVIAGADARTCRAMTRSDLQEHGTW